jgi:hypothetical protein
MTRRITIQLAIVASAGAVTAYAGAQAPPGIPRLSPAGYLMLDFWYLGSFDYNPKDLDTPTPRQVTGTIPAHIRALDGQRIEIAGNILPLDFDASGTAAFILNANVDACGFGGVPRINEWVHVKMKAGSKVRAAKPGDGILVRGTFHVAEQVEVGRVVGLYSIVADGVEFAKGVS